MAFVLVSITAAASARLSGTSSVRPLWEMASRSGQEIVPEVLGGKFSGGLADDGGGTGVATIAGGVETRPDPAPAARGGGDRDRSRGQRDEQRRQESKTMAEQGLHTMIERSSPGVTRV